MPRLVAVIALAAALAAALLPLLPATAQPPMPPPAFRLDDHHGQHRVLLIFAPSERAPAFEMQRDLLRGDAEGMEARDLLLVTVLHAGGSRAGDRSLSPDDGQALRERFGVGPDDFALILIGKDGTEKRRDDAPVEPSVLFDQIDGMPMRQREMRQGGSTQGGGTPDGVDG